MKKRLKQAAWETVRLLKQARLLGHGTYHRALAKPEFQESVAELKLAHPRGGELESEYHQWLLDLKQLKDFLAVKMYLKNRILVQGSHRFSNLDMALVLLDLLGEKNCSSVAHAIIGSEVIFSAIILPLELAADWNLEDERRLSEDVKWRGRKRLLKKAGAAALLVSLGCYWLKKKNNDQGAK
jgi:hypothetical protein